MESRAFTPSPTVSNLVPSWEDAVGGGGGFEPAEAATVVEQAVQPEAGRRTRLVTPPRNFDDAPAERRAVFAYDLLREEPADATPVGHLTAARNPAGELDDEGLPVVDYDALRRRDIARELLRARLVGLAEQREHRTAYEIVFIMLAAAVAILLAAPPLVQVLLAAHGLEA